jgi:hypothetical protein
MTRSQTLAVLQVKSVEQPWVDGEPDSRFDQIRYVNIDDSASILGEAIQALVKSNKVQPNDVAGTTITGAVDSVVAKNLWDETGTCAGSAVSAHDKDRADTVSLPKFQFGGF